MMSQAASFFAEHGYVFIPGYLQRERCERLLQGITRLRNAGAMIVVERSSPIEKKSFLTINGEELERGLPDVRSLCEDVNASLNAMASEAFVPVDNKAIAVSVNVVPPGGEFSWHYDRNAVTAVLYLNSVGGGEIQLHPRYRWLKSRSQRGAALWGQRLLDAAMRPAPMRRMLAGSPVVLRPQAGALLLMEAARCLHRVGLVRGNVERYSVQLAYDAPGATFNRHGTRGYYGYR
jgi:hypothetical protein